MIGVERPPAGANDGEGRVGAAASEVCEGREQLGTAFATKVGTHKEQPAAPSILARLDVVCVGWSERTDSGRNYVDSLRCDAQTIA